MIETATVRACARIRAELHRRKQNQSDLAGLIGWTQSKVSKVLNGETELNLEDLDALCFGVGLRLTEVVRDHGLEFCAEMSPSELCILEGIRQRGPETAAAIMRLLYLKAPDAPQAMPLRKKARKLSA
jgi:transcriptional regulator with XRE-family HTH domain